MNCPKCFENIDKLIEEAEKAIWKRAERAANNCIKHYGDPMGDPMGCLMGLAEEFRAMADGCGPDDI